MIQYVLFVIFFQKNSISICIYVDTCTNNSLLFGLTIIAVNIYSTAYLSVSCLDFGAQATALGVPTDSSPQLGHNIPIKETTVVKGREKRFNEHSHVRKNILKSSETVSPSLWVLILV